MKNEMPTRKSPTKRARDWGNTPILFSLKNVQPLLVAAPPRPEGNVAAPSSVAVAEPAVPPPTPQPIPFSLEPEGPRVKPRAISKLGALLKNSIAVTVLVLLVLLVIKISGGESQLGKPTTPTTTALDSTSVPQSIIESAIVPAPAAPVSAVAAVPAVTPQVEPASARESLPTASSVNPPLLLTASSPIPAASQPAASEPAQTRPASQEGEPVFHGNTGAFELDKGEIPTRITQPTPSPEFSSMKPIETAPPAAKEAVWSPASSPAVPASQGALDISIHTTSTPDLPTESVIDLWNRANGKTANDPLLSAKQPVPYTPVSVQTMAPSRSSSYQPISTGWDLATPALPGPSFTSQPNVSSATVTPNPTPSWSNLTSSAQPSATTQLSGQSYPPKTQEYRPLTVQPTEPVLAPNTSSGTINRYQPIRQPAGGQAGPATSYGYPPIQ